VTIENDDALRNLLRIGADTSILATAV